MHPRLLSLLLLSACMAAHAGPLVLKDHALVAGARVTLADLAQGGDAAALARVDLGAAPLPGYTARYTRTELARTLRTRALPYTLAADGAQAVAVDRATQAFDAQLLSGAAEQQLRQQWAGQADRLTVRLAAPLNELPLPLGQVTLQARPVPAAALHARTTVWVDVLLDGAFLRSVAVPFEVQAYRQVLVATRALAAGALPGCDSLALAERDIAALDSAPVPADCHAVQGHLKRALAPDAVLQALLLQARLAVTQGQDVALRLDDGAIVLEARATALDEGDVGQSITVKLAGGHQAVRAEVTGPGLVRISGK